MVSLEFQTRSFADVTSLTFREVESIQKGNFKLNKLAKLTDVELDAAALLAAKNERLALVVVLEHLAEVDRRKSFSPRFESIAAYAIGHLGYDSKSAWRRVNALRLMQELPEITPAIESGKLDLTKLVIAQNHFRAEANIAKAASFTAADTATAVGQTISLIPPVAAKPRSPITPAQKFEVLQAVMTQTSREAQRDLLAKSSAPEKLKRPDLVKPLNGDSNEVRVVLSDADLDLLKELRGLLAHKLPHASTSDIVSAALKQAVAAIKKGRSGENKVRRAARESIGSDARIGTTLRPKIAAAENIRRPGAELKRRIWNRARGRCEICSSSRALEFDHLIPFAKGGKTAFENLRLTCRNCNQREAIKIFGPRTIRCREVLYGATGT